MKDLLLVVIARAVDEALYTSDEVHNEVGDDHSDVENVSLHVDVAIEEPVTASALLVTS